MRSATTIRRTRRRGGRHPAPPAGETPPPGQGAAREERPARGPEVLLAWALDREQVRVHVASLDPRHRRARAPFACLGCGEELVPRLGALRARHFAHRPGSTCPLTRPETALHLNAKERLLFLCGEAFAGRLVVRLRARCPACRREAPIALAAAGDHAVAEAAVGQLRADVLVTRAGAPALAFEVKVTHALDAAKQEALSELGVPALEIDAREAWEEEDAGGVAVRVARTLGLPACGSCQAVARVEAGRGRGGEAAAVAELEAYRARGLMGKAPGPALASTAPLGPDERSSLEEAFRCPECGERTLLHGDRLVRHACPAGDRPVAWRGYDGELVVLGWWRGRRA